ncbi:glycosyl transferase [Salinibacterium sp. SYSU T00001]|uniref:glycosyltransferase n=1 Tax=Homoserinimonas sedimenticola TaxID=2986805 RepID=UPI002235703E|nr:glycosyl transferase [Salinibacterium sedimenticola]MCW4385445.1 glycosyl transferase [Salinibacterium sedimenticola]
MAGTGEHERRLVVLESIGQLRETTNPYIVQLIRSLESEAEVKLFSWRTALAGRWDVLHVHWPELLVVRDSRLRTFARTLLCLLLVVRLRLTRRALVRTAHNIAPHDDRGLLVTAVLRVLDRVTTLWVTLNDATPVPGSAPRVVIPHGHYSDWYAGFTRPEAVPGRVLFFGLIRRYKNVTGLVRAFAGMPDATASLHIVGKPRPAELADELAAVAVGDERVEFAFGYASDESLVREMGEAELVALPYSEMHNSGAMLLALSLGRPVLAPENEVTTALADEVGHAWVRRYSGDLTSERLQDALAAGIPQGTPDLARRDWPQGAAAHVVAFRRAVALVRHERRYSE